MIDDSTMTMLVKTIVFNGFLIAALLIVDFAAAQEVYELSTGGAIEASFAVKQGEGLLIRDAGGHETFYRRDSRFDDGDQWSGYFSREALQALQWPQSNNGAMRIGSQQADQQWHFAPSRMSIRSLSSSSNNRGGSTSDILPPTNVVGGVSPTVGLAGENSAASSNVAGQLISMNFTSAQAPIPMQLGWGDSRQRMFLSRQVSGGLGIVPQSAYGSQNWFIAPIGNGLARVQYIDNGMVLALGRRSDSSPLDLYAFADTADQLWRINPYPNASGCYALESMRWPGQALTFQQNHISLAPMAYSPYQQWWPTQPFLPRPQPVYRNRQQNIVANPPLPPAQVELMNRHSDALIILLGDRRGGGAARKIRIPSGGSQTVTLERDSGGALVENYEVVNNFGAWDRREYRTSIPPAMLYDVSVYEEFLQSIAIDRTGSSPNPIEDINYQPRSVGFFNVPPGDALPQRTQFDLYRMAESAKNAGAVRRLNPEDYDQKLPTSDPLKDILREFQKRRGSF
jgi:hypothetical protein